MKFTFPNAAQAQSLVRKVTTAVGPILAIVGLVRSADWEVFSQAVYNAIGPVSAVFDAAHTVLGPAAVLIGGALFGGSIWSGLAAHSNSAQIAAVNDGDNGVKVVDERINDPTVTQALK